MRHFVNIGKKLLIKDDKGFHFINFKFQLQIIVAISEIPSFLASFLYPVIAMSTNKDEPSHIYFLEDALELWLVVVQNSTTLTPELLQLSVNLLPIIGKTLPGFLQDANSQRFQFFSILQKTFFSFAK